MRAPSPLGRPRTGKGLPDISRRTFLHRPPPWGSAALGGSGRRLTSSRQMSMRDPGARTLDPERNRRPARHDRCNRETAHGRAGTTASTRKRPANQDFRGRVLFHVHLAPRLPRRHPPLRPPRAASLMIARASCGKAGGHPRQSGSGALPAPAGLRGHPCDRSPGQFGPKWRMVKHVFTASGPSMA